ncbi:MAG: hypothetical protein KGR98_00335 [Verrucomicrobia bacterium]|nr:hypothetical protein [Verrucomicrobiota bacterium]MDE3098274.1 hypothetical protein [Verrucomicrobiota bacterium]
MIKFNLFAACALAGMAFAALAADPLPPPSPRPNVTYTADIKPIFDDSCVKCHRGKKPHGKLKLDSLQGVLKGGQDGKVVIPGNSAKSLLVRSVAHTTTDHDLWMPTNKKKNAQPLTPEQIGLIRAWIDQGAK